MFETTTTRHNHLIDPMLHAWSWEIPLYLFFGGIVAGMMIIGGLAMLRTAKGEDTRGFFSMQTPLLGFILMNIGMLALLLDLTHRLYVWRIYLTFEVTSPMSWGSWVLLIVYGVLMVSALMRLPDAWPWLARVFPPIKALSDSIVAKPQWIAALGWANIVLGIGLGIYTGILLNTMVARPLWNSAILGPLFLVSGLSAGVAVMHITAVLLQGRKAGPGMIGGAISAMLQPLGAQHPEKRTSDALIRYDQIFLIAELIFIGLFIANLLTSSASHAAAASLIMTGAYALPFWGIVVGVGVVLPLLWQAAELSHKVPHTVLPALLVLVGGYTLRWIMVNAGQASHIIASSAGGL
jgi:formate-dependent nitrite reductase membrane component NrfD